jgi:hypothetical protein
MMMFVIYSLMIFVVLLVVAIHWKLLMMIVARLCSVTDCYLSDEVMKYLMK